jgi:hypothetical protein
MVAAISNTPGPNFPPTSIMRIGNMSSPGFNPCAAVNSLKIFSKTVGSLLFEFSKAVQSASKKFFLLSSHLGAIDAVSMLLGAAK